MAAVEGGGMQASDPRERLKGVGQMDNRCHSLDLPENRSPKPSVPARRSSEAERGTQLSSGLDSTTNHPTVWDVTEGSVDTTAADGQEIEVESTELKCDNLVLSLEAAPECEVMGEVCPGQAGGESGGWSDTAGDALGLVDPHQEMTGSPESDQMSAFTDVSLDNEPADGGEVDSFGGEGDGVGICPQPETFGLDVTPSREQEQGERGSGVSGSTAPTLEGLNEKIEGTRQEQAWSQTEIRWLVDKLNESNCQIDVLQRELATERERNGLYVERMAGLEKELGGSSALMEVLSECRWKVEQFEELKASSEELEYKFQESKETAVHLRERIIELESQNVIKEHRIKELRHQLSECRKTMEISPVLGEINTLNGSGLERVEEETPKKRDSSRRNGHAVSASAQPQRKQSASHSEQPPTATTKVCIVL